MFFILTIAGDAAKIRDEMFAPTSLAPVWWQRRVLLMCVLADAARPPLVNIEAFPSGQPPLTELLRAPRDKLEFFTWAVQAA